MAGRAGLGQGDSGKGDMGEWSLLPLHWFAVGEGPIEEMGHRLVGRMASSADEVVTEETEGTG
jgi:hypothetical protein